MIKNYFYNFKVGTNSQNGFFRSRQNLYNIINISYLESLFLLKKRFGFLARSPYFFRDLEGFSKTENDQ